MGKLTQKAKKEMFHLLASGLGQREVSRLLKIPLSTVSWHANKQGFKPGPKKGRPKILSSRDENFIAKEISTGRIENATKMSREIKERFDISVSRLTVSRVLKNKGFKSAEKKEKPQLSSKNIKSRFEFAKSHKDWTLDDWKRVIFSDETKINRFNSDGRTWYWSKDPSILDEKSVKPSVKHGGGGILLWGCLTFQGVGYCCKIDSTMDQYLYKSILEDDLMKSIRYYNLDPSKVIFQHDNDPKHTAKSVKEWLAQQEFQVMIWPAQSPDLNPIEHLWFHVKKTLNQFETPARGINELWERIQNVWNEISPEICSNLIESMPRRIEAVFKAKGKWTKY
jgi:transposase